MRMNRGIWFLITGMLLLSCSVSKNRREGNASLLAGQNSIIKSDSTKTIIKPYIEVITDKAVSQHGLMDVHKVGDRFYFEVADSLLNKDILIVNRVIKAAAGFRTETAGYGGDQIGENVIQFSKGPGNKIFMVRKSYLDISRDSSQNGMYRSVLNSSMPAIIAAFDIKAFAIKISGSVIDVTDFLNGDNDIFFFNSNVKDAYKLGGIQADKSYIVSIRSFPLNTEIKTVKTYTHEKDLLTYELNSSIVLLPDKPMNSRSYDPRVGYFSRGYYNYDAPTGVNEELMITRWRMEPREEDIEKYKRGELVEPKKPIIYYIDPATPSQWIPYLIRGVNAWQKAFEMAGFKNAIYALKAPTDDSTWSLEDARHNAIIYKASTIQNASGPQVNDPRSGEILESHINWYHNVQQLLHDMYFVQASPCDPAGRLMEYDVSLMGQLIQYVCTHEVGHTLGLMHNFRASSSIPVDSLRSRHYVAINGHTPSIMDYARFNYVAQPEDSIPQKDLIPRIGIYDEWAIEWGYRYLPDLVKGREENSYLKNWIVKKQLQDKRLVYMGESGLYNEPRTYMEDLGDDPMKAGYYGIKNLKLIMSRLVDWTKTPNKDYSDLARLNDAVIDQYSLYIMHVLRSIGGEYMDLKTADQPGEVLSFVSKERQKAAMQFLQQEVFNVPEWLFNKKVYRLTGSVNQTTVGQFQLYAINKLDYNGFFRKKLFEQLIQPSGKAYSFDEVLTDLEKGIWSELNSNTKISYSRRIIQKGYVNNLLFNIRSFRETEIGQADWCSIMNDHVNLLLKKIKIALPGYTDKDSRSHLKDVMISLELIQNIQSEQILSATGASEGKRVGSHRGLTENHDNLNRSADLELINGSSGCWNYDASMKWRR
jgi:hypothetical protein